MQYRLVRGLGRSLQPEEKYLGLTCSIVGECPTGAAVVLVDTPWNPMGETDSVDVDCLEDL